MIRLGTTARGLIPLYSTTAVLALGHGMVIPIIPVLATSFDISIGLAAQVVTAGAVGRFIGQPVGGVVVDRFGARAAMLGGPAAVAVGALAAAATPWFPALLLGMVVAGAGDSSFMLGREIAGIDLVRSQQRGRLMSGFFGFNSVGMALGPVLGGLVTVVIGFQAVFAAYAAFGMLTLLIAIGTRTESVPKTPVAAVGSSAARERLGARIARQVRSLAGLLREVEPRFRRTYAVLVFATFSMMLYRMTLHSMLPLYAGSQLGFSPTQVGVLFSISGAFVVVMIVPAGFIMDKVGRKWATVPSTAMPGIAFLFFPFADTFLQLAVLAGVLGIANGLSLGSVAVSTYDVVPAHARGRLQAIRRTVAETGAVGGPAAGGAIANAFGPSVPFVVFAPVILLAAALLAFASRETLVKPPGPRPGPKKGAQRRS